MTPQGQPTTSALQALVRDGTLTGSWTLDPARSEILLQTRHTWGLRPLHGVFRQVAGNGTVTGADQVTGTLTVAAGSVDTKNKMRDKDLRSAKVFDIASHPDITYTVDGMQPAVWVGAIIVGAGALAALAIPSRRRAAEVSQAAYEGA